jgi:DNA polymerase-1
VKIPITVVKTESEALAFLMSMSRQKVVAIDTETHPGDAARSKVVVWSAGWEGMRAVILGSLLHVFEGWFGDPQAKKVFHNAKYDLRVLQNKEQRLTVRGFHADTMVMSWLVDENNRHGLKERALEDLNIRMTDFIDTFGTIPDGKKKPVAPDLFDVLKNEPEKLFKYASLDAYATFLLYEKYREALGGLKLWDYYLEIERPYTLLLMQMEDAGITIDVPYMERVDQQVTRHAAMLKHMIRNRAVEETGDYRWMTLNPRSPKLKELVFGQLMWPVLAETEAGAPCLDAAVLEKYIEKNEALAILLGEYRGSDKLKSGFVTPILTSARYSPNGRVSTDINQIGTVTGRTSSRRQQAFVEETGKVEKVGINLQNVPARADKDPYTIRKAFVAAKDKLIVVADFSQIELRLIADASKDKVMLDAYNNKPEKDLHIITSCSIAKHILSKAEAKLCLEPDWGNKNAIKAWKAKYDDSLRSPYAKPVNFGLNYGMQAYTLAQRLKIPEDKAQDIIDAYFERYEGVADYIARQIAFATQNGYVVTLTGRRRRLVDITSDDFGSQKHAERQAVNVPIQGGVADVVKRAQVMLMKDDRIKKLKATMLIQVHDELVYEAPKEAAEETLKVVCEVMEAAGRYFNLAVPTPATGGFGRSWSEAKS